MSWDLSGISLSDGRFTAEIMTTNPNALVQTRAMEFHVRRGDLNGDSRVNFADYGVVGAGFNPIGLDPLSYDWGDSGGNGSNFPTARSQNGARHVLGTGLQLGAIADSDADGQPSSSADLDTGDDGIVFGIINPESTADVDVTAKVVGNAFLNAWIDFNQDGDWLDDGEQILVDQPVVGGTQQLQFDVPVDAAVGSALARFRLTSAPGYSFTGLAADGEVEDYLVVISSAAPPLSVELPIGGSDERQPRFAIAQLPLVTTTSLPLALTGSDRDDATVTDKKREEWLSLHDQKESGKMLSKDKYFELASDMDFKLSPNL